MINGIGVLGWGVGGIEAEAAMLGQPSSMLIPQVVGFKLTGKLPEGATATDLVLTVTQMLRKHGVVGKFVEFFGDGLQHLPLADRATIGNMAPEYGATCGIFPIDAEAINYLRLSGRDAKQIALVEAYAKAQGLWHDATTPHAEYQLDARARPRPTSSRRSPARSARRIACCSKTCGRAIAMRSSVLTANRKPANETDRALRERRRRHRGRPRPERARARPARVACDGQDFELCDGAVVIAAITSCTNTSNPAVMLGAGLLARKAAGKGLKAKPWVKTSLGAGLARWSPTISRRPAC